MAFCKKIVGEQAGLVLQPATDRCRYHRCRSEIPYEKMASRGLCLEAFHSLFPIGFAMFSAPGDRVPDGVRVVCPAGKVELSLRRRPYRVLKDMPGQILRRIASVFFPIEVLRWRIMITVSSAGECPYAYKGGEEFEIDLGHLSNVCPAASNSFFPFFVPKLFGGAQSIPAVACPDHKTNVVASSKSPEDPATDEVDERICLDPASLRVEVMTAGSGTPDDVRDGGVHTVAELLKRSGLPCLAFLNTLAPYVQTLRSGGRLGFYTDTYDSAIVQCPSPGRKVVVRVQREKDGSTSYQVESTRSDCPRGMKTGAAYSSKAGPDSLFWSQALACMGPYILNHSMARGTEAAFSFSESSEKPTIFKIL